MRFFFYLFVALNISAMIQAQITDADIDVKTEDKLVCPGDIDITAGDDLTCPGSVNITSGGPMNGGDVNITSGGGNQSGDINIKTGWATHVGNINIGTSFTDGSQASIDIYTEGSAAGGGHITIQTASVMAAPNPINIIAGDAGFPSGSNINITAGDSYAGTGGSIVLTPGTGSSDANGLVQVIGSGTYTGTWTQSSDERFKKNINDVEGSLNSVLQLRGVNFEFRTEEFPDKGFNKGKQTGLIAQEVEKVYPEFVITDDEGYKSVAYQNLVAVLIEAIKEQQKQIENLNSRIENLADKLEGNTVDVSSLNK